MQEIINEFSQLKQMDRFDLSLEALGDGFIKVSVVDQHRQSDKAERVISPEESLSFISETFNYPDTFTPRSKDFALESLKMAYFNDIGRLVVEHEDSTEEFRVRPDQKKDVIEVLKRKLGDKLKT